MLLLMLSGVTMTHSCSASSSAATRTSPSTSAKLAGWSHASEARASRYWWTLDWGPGGCTGRQEGVVAGTCDIWWWAIVADSLMFCRNVVQLPLSPSKLVMLPAHVQVHPVALQNCTSWHPDACQATASPLKLSDPPSEG